MEDKTLKELDKVVYLTEKADRKGETFSSALINRLRETQEIGDTGYVREVVITVPKDSLNDSLDAKTFIKMAGEISRDSSFGLPVNLENVTAPDLSGNPIVLINVVFKYSDKTNVARVIEFLNT